jgi:hypothetical protein
VGRVGANSSKRKIVKFEEFVKELFFPMYGLFFLLILNFLKLLFL